MDKIVHRYKYYADLYNFVASQTDNRLDFNHIMREAREAFLDKK